MIKWLSANRIVSIETVTKLLALNMFAHGASVKKTTTLTNFSRGCKFDQTLNSRKFAWSGKCGQNTSFNLLGTLKKAFYVVQNNIIITFLRNKIYNSGNVLTLASVKGLMITTNL